MICHDSDLRNYPDHIFDPPAGAVQLPGSHSLLSPSTRKRMEVKDKTKSVWRFEILLENLHRVDLGMSNARWGMLIVAFDREYEVEVTRGQDDSAVFGNDRFSIFFRGNANSLRKWLEDQAPIEFHLLKRDAIVTSCKVPVYDIYSQMGLSGVFPMDLTPSDSVDEEKGGSKFSRMHKINMPLLSVSIELNPFPVAYSAVPPSQSESDERKMTPMPIGMRLDKVLSADLEMLIPEEGRWT